MCKIIGIGNALVDVLVTLQEEDCLKKVSLPKGGMTLVDEDRQRELEHDLEELSPHYATGGSAGNTILALSGLGADVTYIGSLAEDKMGRFFAETYRNMGIELRALWRKGHTGVANTFITPDGERTFATFLGVAREMQAEDITEDLFYGGNILHIEGYLVQNHDLMEAICKRAKNLGLKLSIDLGSYNIVREDNAFFHHLVKDYIDIVFANEKESEAFTGIDDFNESLQIISDLCEVCIIKLGSRGASAMKHSGERAIIPANKIKVVDTTAAGDFFAGGFLYAYSHSSSLEKCLQCGAHLSENIIQVIGTHMSDETWQNIRIYINNLIK